MSAKQASAQVRDDMKEERSHAVKMRLKAIAGVAHSIKTLELSMAESMTTDNEEEHAKKEHMIESLCDSLHDLEETTFKK